MTKIKLCGLTRIADIEVANELLPEYIGFVFAKKSRRYVTPKQAATLKRNLRGDISAVGVFVNESVDVVAELSRGIIDVIQLHGNEDEAYIAKLRTLVDKPIIKAVLVNGNLNVDNCSADYILLDSGAGTGKVFDWQLLGNIKRQYFLAGGLGVDNVRDAIEQLQPFAVDVSSGIESNGVKDADKMRQFVRAVRGDI